MTDTSKRKSMRRRNRRRLGGATVEFALAVPIIFAMFFGAVELTRLNFIRQSASNACYEGARKVIVPGGTASDANTAATTLLTNLGCGTGATASTTTTSTTVTITVTIPVAKNSWGVSWFFPNTNVVQTLTLSKESLN